MNRHKEPTNTIAVISALRDIVLKVLDLIGGSWPPWAFITVVGGIVAFRFPEDSLTPQELLPVLTGLKGFVESSLWSALGWLIAALTAAIASAVIYVQNRRIQDQGKERYGTSDATRLSATDQSQINSYPENARRRFPVPEKTKETL